MSELPYRKGSLKSNHIASIKSILNSLEMKGDSLDSDKDKVFIEEEDKDNVNKVLFVAETCF